MKWLIRPPTELMWAGSRSTSVQICSTLRLIKHHLEYFKSFRRLKTLMGLHPAPPTSKKPRFSDDTLIKLSSRPRGAKPHQLRDISDKTCRQNNPECLPPAPVRRSLQQGRLSVYLISSCSAPLLASTEKKKVERSK